MSTRAMYTFKDKDTTVHVYKHYDGYPSGAAQWIAAALDYAWQLPRFEADDFAAAFVAANKPSWKAHQKWVAASYKDKTKAEREAIARYATGGGVLLVTTKEPWEFSADAAYWYVIEFNGKELQVTAFDCDWWETPTQTEIYKGSLSGLAKWAKERESEA